MTEINLYIEKFEKMRLFISNDLRNSSIYGHANFLVAMGLFNYAEILGGFGLKSTPRASTSKDRFNYVFYKPLPKEYKNIWEANIPTIDPYNCLRCGMTHEYLAKTYSNIDIGYTIRGVNTEEEYNRNILEKTCGIEITQIEKDKFHIDVHNPRFIHDLNSSFEEFKKRIKSDTIIQEYFLQRCNDIRLERFV